MTDQTLTPVDNPWSDVTLTPVAHDPFLDSDLSASSVPAQSAPPSSDPFLTSDFGQVAPHQIDPSALAALDASIPAKFAQQYAGAVADRYNAGADMASQGAVNLHQGNLLAGVPQSLGGAAVKLFSPVTGAWDVAADDLDPAFGIGHSAPHAFSAGDLIPAAMAERLRPAPDLLEKKGPFIYDPPNKPLRAFPTDYKAEPEVGPDGRLRTDIEGRPLGEGLIAGRRTLGGADVALTPEELDAVSQGAIGSIPETVAARTLPPGAIGAYRVGYDKAGNVQRSIGVLNTLPSAIKDRAAAHEIGHVIDEFAGHIDPTGLGEEPRIIYNDLNNPSSTPNRGPRFGPEQNGYSGDKVPRELMAEAIRSYFANPNYTKTVAPRTAAAIRSAWNANPRFSKLIQFNTLGGIGVGTAAALAGSSMNPQPANASSYTLTPLDGDPFAK